MQDDYTPHPALMTLLNAELSERDVYALGEAYFAVVGKSQLLYQKSGGLHYRQHEVTAGREFLRSLGYFVTGTGPTGNKR
jgi:hypothetical protein